MIDFYHYVELSNKRSDSNTEKVDHGLVLSQWF